MDWSPFLRMEQLEQCHYVQYLFVYVCMYACICIRMYVCVSSLFNMYIRTELIAQCMIRVRVGGIMLTIIVEIWLPLPIYRYVGMYMYMYMDVSTNNIE